MHTLVIFLPGGAGGGGTGGTGGRPTEGTSGSGPGGTGGGDDAGGSLLVAIEAKYTTVGYYDNMSVSGNKAVCCEKHFYVLGFLFKY